MTKPMQLIAIILFFMSSTAVMAGTIIELQNNNELNTVITDGNQVRMNMGGSDYMIVDYRSHSVRVVSPQKQQVMLLDTGSTAAMNKTPLVRSAVKNLGTGQAVAGYNTQKYGFTANGKSCGLIYGSKDAYQAQGIKELLAAMRTMMQKQRDMLGAFASLVDDCTLADMSITDHINTIGVPMRTERNGKVETEVKSIKTDVSLPADVFHIPPTYKSVNMLGQVQAIPKDISQTRQQAQQHQPQTQQMAQQMQHSGQLLPEAHEQMRRAQQMRQQYQQR